MTRLETRQNEMRNRQSRKVRFRHGQTRSLTYKSWGAIKTRCLNPKSKNYSSYGAKGITICDRWRWSFAAFLADMGQRPLGTTIDRFPNRSGNYEPGNCRWATPAQQSQNQISTKLTPAKVAAIRLRALAGERKASIARTYGVSHGVISAVTQGKTWTNVV